MSQSQTALDAGTVYQRVTQLLNEFFAHLDRAEPVGHLLTEEAEFRGVTGRDAVVELLLSLSRKRDETGRTSRHFSSNISIDELGEGRYRVRSLVVVLSRNTQPVEAGELLAGDHDDVVEFDDEGTVRFVSRAMTPAFKLDLATA